MGKSKNSRRGSKEGNKPKRQKLSDGRRVPLQMYHGARRQNNKEDLRATVKKEAYWMSRELSRALYLRAVMWHNVHVHV